MVKVPDENYSFLKMGRFLADTIYNQIAKKISKRCQKKQKTLGVRTDTNLIHSFESP